MPEVLVPSTPSQYSMCLAAPILGWPSNSGLSSLACLNAYQCLQASQARTRPANPRSSASLLY